ncbi:MAG TPA: dipeptidase [Spirochaetota bacterium]|nr:dipeptidase [Spirochaetota bacterium]
MKKKATLAAAVSIMMFSLFCSPIKQVDSFMNGTASPPAYKISETTEEFHNKLIIADLHCDALLWERDLLERHDWGHVDFPRLIEGNIAIQAFTIVSLLPLTMNNSCNFSTPDGYCCLAMMQGWPSGSWFNFRGRAMYQIKKLHEAERRSEGKFTLILSKKDLEIYLERRKVEPGITAGFIGIEGSYPLGGSSENLDAMFNAGVRMLGLTHFADSAMGGSTHGFMKQGLTAEGRKLIKLMNRKGILIDLAHASRKTIKDILSITTRPVVFSHTGVKGMCDNNRNITDDEIIGVAAKGGVIGIGFFSKATCGSDIGAVIESIKYVSDMAGVDHVALGSDFDGLVSTPVDSSNIIYITDALLKAGFTPEETAKIMGKNTVRVLMEVLP